MYSMYHVHTFDAFLESKKNGPYKVTNQSFQYV